jgi:DNA-binding Lrp family transcriptional regulator
LRYAIAKTVSEIYYTERVIGKRRCIMASRKAFVLIITEMGQLGNALKTLRARKGIQEVDVITGPYDLIAILSGSDTNEIANIVVNNIHSVTGIKHTVTLIVV